MSTFILPGAADRLIAQGVFSAEEYAKAEEKDSNVASEIKWPNGELTFYSGYEVGSLMDSNQHIIADWISKETGMPVKIVNGETAGGAELAAKLADANSDGQTIMAIGVQNIHSYYNGFWKVNPADFSKFKIVAGNIQPNPDCGNMILTQTDAPFNTWEEFVKYVEEHPVEITAVSMPGKVMDLKMKALFNGTGVSKNIRWVPVASNAEATTALLNGTINCVMLDELTASHYLEDGTCKALINCRMDNDYSMYGNDPAIEKMKAVPTLLDVFGADAEKYMVPNRSVIIVPAGTPDDICDAIAKVINRIDEEPIGSEFYDKSHFIGGTSKYYSWPGDKIMAEWSRLDPIIKEICGMML